MPAANSLRIADPLDVLTRDLSVFKAFQKSPCHTWSEAEQPVNFARTYDPKDPEGPERYTEYARATNRMTAETEFPRAARRLMSFERLAENWNGDRALPPSSATLEKAYEILSELLRMVSMCKAIVPEPRVTCGAKGDINFSWTVGSKELELGVAVERGMTRYEYFLCLGQEEASEEGSFEGNLSDSGILQQLCSWF
jgi:hypothetical protein